MDVRLIPKKIEQRLNKLGSFDFDNIECWQIIEAFNKVQIEFPRNQIAGANKFRTGDETTTQMVDDLQFLLKPATLKGVNRNDYFESELLPEDYLAFKRVFVYASTESCENQKIKCDLVEEANIDTYLDDPNINPSFGWRTTLATLFGNKIRIYTNSQFKVNSLELVYYRYPRKISLSGCLDISGNPGTNIDPEFKDDIVEILVDSAAAVLAGDIQDINQVQILTQRTQKNT